MNNATHAISPEQSPVRVICPSWCVSHSEYDEDGPDHAVLHYGEENEAAGHSVRLTRYDWVPQGMPGEATVLLNDTPLSLQQAAALGGLLAVTASKCDASEQTIVRVLDLPEGQDYVVFRDCNVVAVASRLDEVSRRRALSEAGVG